MYRWSDLELKKTAKGEECREHRTSYKTRTGMTKDVRPFGPKKNCRSRKHDIGKRHSKK